MDSMKEDLKEIFIKMLNLLLLMILMKLDIEMLILMFSSGINLFWFPSAFEHFRRYGRYEGRLTRPEYIISLENSVRSIIS
jgi:hypothetical protein